MHGGAFRSHRLLGKSFSHPPASPSRKAMRRSVKDFSRGECHQQPVGEQTGWQPR